MNPAETPVPAEHDTLVLVPVPPLVGVLLALERQKGSRLTEDEVLAARDQAVCMQLSAAVARRMEEARGYPDLDLPDVWAAWERYRNGQEY